MRRKHPTRDGAVQRIRAREAGAVMRELNLTPFFAADWPKRAFEFPTLWLGSHCTGSRRRRILGGVRARIDGNYIVFGGVASTTSSTNNFLAGRIIIDTVFDTVFDNGFD